MNRETSTAAEVLDLLESDLGGTECLEDLYVTDFLRLTPDAVRVFDGKTIRWMKDDEQDPYDFSDPWVGALEPGCYIHSPVEGLSYAYIIASVPGPGGGRWACLWKGKLLDPSEAE